MEAYKALDILETDILWRMKQTQTSPEFMNVCACYGKGGAIAEQMKGMQTAYQNVLDEIYSIRAQADGELPQPPEDRV